MNKLFTVIIFCLLSFNVSAQWNSFTGTRTDVDLSDIYVRGQKIIAVGTAFTGFTPYIYISENNGASWDSIMVPPSGYFFKSITFKDADTGFIGGYGNSTICLKTTDGGKHWSYIFADTANKGITDMIF
jgi:photosystem II stability/assembly factor-like uncharacterized protein